MSAVSRGDADTVAGVLAPAMADRPDHQALVAPSGALTYRELDAAADAAASALWRTGVRPGDRVAACLPNDLDIVIAFHGAQRIGAVWVGIGEAYARPEQDQLASLAQPRIVLAGPRCTVEGPTTVELSRWRVLVAEGGSVPTVAIDPFGPAGIAYTSGTTGVPKGVVHSQHNFLLPGATLVSTRGWDSALRKGDSLPMTILNMLVLNTLTAAQARGCAVLIDRRDVGGIVQQVAQHDVTVWNGVPAQVYDLVHRPELDLSSLRELWSGGGDCPDELRTAMRTVHGVDVHSTYGLTEAPTVVAIDPFGGAFRHRASGRCLPHLDVAAYDDDGARVGTGDVGEIRIRATRTGAWADAWRPPLGEWIDGGVVAHGDGDEVRTGDIGTVDAEGWVTVVDRRKLVIVRGGANVYPTEIERVLRLHDSVEDVVVFGVPDERLGERVAALLVTRGPVPKEDLRVLCAENLATYKIPDRWGRVDHLPNNAMGKTSRVGLADILRGASEFDQR